MKLLVSGIIGLMLVACAATSSSQSEQTQTQVGKCQSENHRAFDFWLGTWSVAQAGATEPRQARNKISAVHNGCVVLEEYVAGAFTGMSINFFDEKLNQWRQTWMSNAGQPLYLKGGISDGSMILSDAGTAASEQSGAINRITWTPLEDGRVRQHWQGSKDQAKTWTTVFDGFYTPIEE